MNPLETVSTLRRGWWQMSVGSVRHRQGLQISRSCILADTCDVEADSFTLKAIDHRPFFIT